MKPKFSAGIWMFGGHMDRFCTKGYSDPISVEEAIKCAGRVDGLEGIECHQTDFDAIDTKRFIGLLQENGLRCSSIDLNVWGNRRWKLGAFAHRDETIRRAAVGEAKRAVDLAREVGSPSVGLWLGSDGFDYPFQIDYRIQWDTLVSSIKEVARYASPNIRVGIEYKLKEPRTHMTIGSVGKALSICLELKMDNLGVVIDFGHALMSRENPGESVAYLSRQKKLFNVHFNDAYGEWDDDMIPGVIHFWETLEFLYYCKLAEYDGWFALDMYPFREDGKLAAEMAVRNIKTLWELCDKMDIEELNEAQRTMDSIEAQKVLWRII